MYIYNIYELLSRRYILRKYGTTEYGIWNTELLVWSEV